MYIANIVTNERKFNKRVSENSFSHATSEAELRASKNMKFTSIFIKASA
jgi:hypothetical protein